MVEEFDKYSVSSDDEDDKAFAKYKKAKAQALPEEVTRQLSLSPLQKPMSRKQIRDAQLKHVLQQGAGGDAAESTEAAIASAAETAAQASAVLEDRKQQQQQQQQTPPRKTSSGMGSASLSSPALQSIPRDEELSNLSRGELIALLKRNVSQNRELARESQETNSADASAREWDLKFNALQEQLHKALEQSVEEKALLEDKIGILEFEKAEAETTKEEHVEMERRTFEQRLAHLQHQYDNKIKVLQSSYNETLQLFEQRLADKEVEFAARFKKWRKWEDTKKAKRQELNNKMAFLEKKLLEMFEANRLEKALMLERLTLAKTEAADAKALAERYEARVEELEEQLEEKEVEFMKKEAEIQKEWTLELEQAEAEYSLKAREAVRDREQLQERVRALESGAPAASSSDEAEALRKKLKEVQVHFQALQRELAQIKMKK